MTTREAAIIRAGERFAAARAERDAIAQREGPQGVARHACPGTNGAAVAQLYTQLQNSTEDGPEAA